MREPGLRGTACGQEGPRVSGPAWAPQARRQEPRPRGVAWHKGLRTAPGTLTLRSAVTLCWTPAGRQGRLHLGSFWWEESRI